MNLISFLTGAAVIGAALLLPLLLFLRRYGAPGSEATAYRHMVVAVAICPLAAGLAWVTAYFSQELAHTSHGLAGAGMLPEPLALLAARVGEVELDVTFLDVEVLACLLYVAYGLVLVERRLVDIARLLKLSLRRTRKPDAALDAQLEQYEKLWQEQEASKLAAAGKEKGNRPPRPRGR